MKAKRIHALAHVLWAASALVLAIATLLRVLIG